MNLDSWVLAARKLFLKSCRALSNGSDNGDDGVSVGANANTDAQSETYDLLSREVSLYVGCICFD